MMSLSAINLLYQPKKTLFVLSCLVAFTLATSANTLGQQSLKLGGTETHVRIASDPALALSEFTIECWIMISAEGTAIRSSVDNELTVPLISRGIEEDETGSFINYFLGLRKADNVLMAEIESAQSEEVPGFNYFIHGYTQLVPQVWYHIAFTFDFQDLKIFLNGNLEASMEVPHLPASDATSDLGIGTAFQTSGTSQGQFAGAIDELRIWDRARMQEEIISAMNSSVESQTENLVLRLGFNEGSGTSLSYIAKESFTVSLEGIDYEWIEGAHYRALNAPQCHEDPILRIGLMADPQYCDCDPRGTRYYRETLWKLPDAIAEFNKEEVDFVVTLGDVIDQYPESYDSVLHYYDALNMPDFKAMGNHEFYNIPDSMKDTIIKLLKMPHYYYDTVYSGYRFIFVDGTEMGLYSRAVHPEIADEADSLWNEIQGEPKAQTWNGGIGRTQRKWIESRIQLADELGQSVILMGHHQIYPDSTIGNMWNDVQMTALFEKYSNVLAYINGHNHWGEKGLKNGIQYFTHKGMVETENTSAYSVLEIFPHKFEFVGFGAQESMVLKVSKQDSVQSLLNMNAPGLSYKSDSGDFAGALVNEDNLDLNYFLLPASEENDNKYFILKEDSLKLQQDTLPLHKSEFEIQIKALTCGFDTIENNIILNFDTIAFTQKGILSDTVLHVESSYSVDLQSFILDKSEFGIVFNTTSSDSTILKSNIKNDSLLLLPNSVGESFVIVEAFDTFSGQSLNDTFAVQIVDTLNRAPIAIHPTDQILVQLSEGSVYFPWEEIFFDANKDSLDITTVSFCESMAAIEVSDSGFRIQDLSSGICDISFWASDHRGGEVQTQLSLRINSPPEIIEEMSDTSLFKGGKVWYDLDTYFTDDDPLVFQFKAENKSVEAQLNGTTLEIHALDTGQCKLVASANDLFGGTDSIDWIVTVRDTSSFVTHISDISKFNSVDLYVFPIPVRGNASINFSLSRAQHLELSLYDISGKKVMSILNGLQMAGAHSLNFDSSQLESGSYFLKLTTETGITSLVLPITK